MKDFLFSKLKFTTGFSIFLTGVLITSAILDGGKTSLLPILLLAAFPIGVLLLTIHLRRKEREDSEGFRRPKPEDIRDYREAMIEGLMGILLSATVIYYGHVAEKIVAIVVSIIIVRLMAILYKSCKE
jgi:hypothetical protein